MAERMGQVLGLLDCLGGQARVVEVGSRRFSVKKRLATGGFSFVDLVSDTQTKDQYAMKRITCTSARETALAKKEIDAYRLFDHPNIIQVVESGETTVNSSGERQQQILCVFPLYEVCVLFFLGRHKQYDHSCCPFGWLVACLLA